MARNILGFMGFENFTWFQGVVEDRVDPLKLGRVKVRVLGIHTDVKDDIPTEDLPWAYPIQPITSASMNGLGHTPMGPVEGTWVIGFFRDSENCQEPVIFGTIAGIPHEYPYPKNKKKGFMDPREDLSARPRKYKKKEYPNDGTGAKLDTEVPTPPTGELYPRTSHPLGTVVDESDINRLARNEKIYDTIVKLKRDTVDENVPVADGTTWSEPKTPYYASYPYNHVLESESGHIIEIDDTVGVERLHNYHKSGTFEEIYPDGIKVEKIVKNSYRIVLAEQYQHIHNRCNLTIDGPFNVIVQNNANVIIKGNAKVDIGKNLDINVGGNFNLGVKGKCVIQSEEQLTLKSNENTLVGSKNTVQLKGALVTSNPPVDQSFESQRTTVAGAVLPGLTITPNQPQPQAAAVNVPSNNGLERIYPIEVPIYPGIMQVFAAVEDNFEETPTITQYKLDLIEAGIVDPPPTPAPVPGATAPVPAAAPTPDKSDNQIVETKTDPPKETKVEVKSCQEFSYEDKPYPSPALDGLKMSANYTLGQIYKHEHIIRPQVGLSVNRILCNIKAAANNILEPLAGKYGKRNLIISSGFRNLGKPNSPTSQHPNGEAFDIQWSAQFAYSNRNDREKYLFDIASEIISSKLVPFDQMILECPGSYGPWIHISYASTSQKGPSGIQRGVVNTWFGGSYLPGLVRRGTPGSKN